LLEATFIKFKRCDFAHDFYFSPRIGGRGAVRLRLVVSFHNSM
jgi:hypothetical protein